MRSFARGLAALGERARPGVRSLLIASFLVAVPTAMFWLLPLDQMVIGAYYQPTAADPWPVQYHPLWQWFYYAIPWLTVLLIIGAILVQILGRGRAGWQRRRFCAWLMLLTLVLGPGVLVNGVFKEHWDRPRPRQTVEFGGIYSHVPPLAFGEDGKSFSCGHCSVGYALIALSFCVGPSLWRGLAILGALAFGTLIGFGRMAAGGHFPSDLLWSAYFSYFAAWVSYYLILDMARRSLATATAPAVSPRPWRPLWGLGAGGAVLVSIVAVSFATPRHQSWQFSLDRTQLRAPAELAILASGARVRVSVSPPDQPVLRLTATLSGFGFPWTKTLLLPQLSEQRVQLAWQRAGWYSEHDLDIELAVAPEVFAKITMDLASGHWQVLGDPTAVPQIERAD